MVDTGATSSVISKAFLKSAGISYKPTLLSTRGAGKSQLDIEGEVHLTLQYGDLELPLSALVIDKLDCDVLCGIPFCKVNDVIVYTKDEVISVRGKTIPYGSKHSSPVFPEIMRVNSMLLRNSTQKIILPGE